MNTELYAEIYDVVAENLSRAEKKFEYGKSTFLCDVGLHPQDVSVRSYMNLSNPEFFEAIYVATMKRLPNEKIRAYWAQKYDLPTDLFQQAVLKSIARSSVVAVNHIHLTDNPYFEQKIGLRYKLLGSLYGLTDKSNLRELGKKLPGPIQNIIRKVFL